MKTSYIFGISLVFLVLIFALSAVANFNHPEASAKNISAAALSLQASTQIPPAEDTSEVGSTDGIVIMGIVLVIVVTIPVLLRRKKFNKKIPRT
jgi:hypothetical protein